MALSNTSLAAAVGSGVKNVQFVSSASVVPRKILIIGTKDPSKTGLAVNTPRQVFSAAEVGSLSGFGFMLHRMAIKAFKGSQGVETWIVPQAEAGGAAASTGDIDFTGSTGVLAGTIYLYIAGDLVSINIADSTSADDIATAVAAAVNANSDLPVTAAVNGVTTAQVDFTAKSKGPWGDKISIALNLDVNQELPSGVAAAITAMSSGSGTPDIDDALNSLGTGDAQNEKYFTDVVHGYLQDSSTLSKISAYNGVGDGYTGNYSKTVARPFRALTGDVDPGTAALTAMIVITDAKKTDRTNGIIAVPDSPSHPSEVAARAIGAMARINNNRAEESYIGEEMGDIWPGTDKADRWSDDYDNRDTAVKSGVSPTLIKNGVVVLQNVVSFYRPDDVPVESNGYRSMRNISIIQNILDNVRANFEQEKWEGISIVADTAKVTNSASRQKARDVNSVIDDLVKLATDFEGNAWLYSASFTIDALKQAGAVVIRDGGTGFNNTLKVVLSGEGGILDNVTEFDTSLDVFLN